MEAEIYIFNDLHNETYVSCPQVGLYIRYISKARVKALDGDPFTLWWLIFVSELDSPSINVLPRFQALVSPVFLLSADNMVFVLSHKRLFWLPPIWPAPMLSALAV